jgi:hypothetical protein
MVVAWCAFLNLALTANLALGPIAPRSLGEPNAAGERESESDSLAVSQNCLSSKADGIRHPIHYCSSIGRKPCVSRVHGVKTLHWALSLCAESRQPFGQDNVA